MLRALPRHLRALVPTRRGHGDADKPAEGYTLEQLTADAAGFLDALGIESAVVVGSSSGGYVAQRLAVDHPGRVRGLVLLGAPRSLRDKPAVAELGAAMATLSDPVEPAFARDFVVGTSSPAVPPDFLERMVEDARALPAHVWRSVLAGLVEATPPTEDGRITAPTFIVWGDDDRFSSRADQEALAARIPGAQLLVYEGVGHVVHWEQPERVAADVATFVDALPTEPA